DRRWVAAVAAGDEDAFRGLFGRYAPMAKALALRVVRQPQMAEEIVQEAFLSVWRHPDGYEPDRGSVRSWLMAMVHHRAVDTVRREESQRRRADQAASVGLRDEVSDHAEEVVAAVELPRERRAVRAALADLPDEQRAIVERMYFGGESQSQIAAATGLPLGTVKSRTLLGMRKLRAALEELER
ncbi:MAG TPA: sigma-70 family RNA polymerase sigma factor, partial [Actinomycetota bacterium]|nr:sigma-70 family RNA polymerase sigma factor [Actinomycetota bacterium]